MKNRMRVFHRKVSTPEMMCICGRKLIRIGHSNMCEIMLRSKLNKEGYSLTKSKVKSKK